MQYTTVAMAALATVASAAPLAERDQSTTFSLLSARSGSPVHLMAFAAREESIFIGGNTSTFCPGQSVPTCGDFRNTTAFVGQPGSPVGISMSANVPGGQALYIAPGGAVKYTIAHSSYQPAGSVDQAYDFVLPNGSTPGTLTPVANGSTGFLACPATAATKETGPWQLYADVEGAQYPSGCVDDCYGIEALADNTDGPTVWQYS